MLITILYAASDVVADIQRAAHARWLYFALIDTRHIERAHRQRATRSSARWRSHDDAADAFRHLQRAECRDAPKPPLMLFRHAIRAIVGASADDEPALRGR